MVVNPKGLLIVGEHLAAALEMYETRTTAEGLAHYICEQANLPKAYYAMGTEPRAVVFLASIAQALTPPADKRMSFRERSEAAAKQATPWDYGEALSTLMELGWGGTHVGVSAGAVRDIGQVLADVLREKAETVALQLLHHWERAGNAISIDRRPA